MSDEPPDDFGLDVMEMPPMSPAFKSLLNSIRGANPEDGFSEEDLKDFTRLEQQ